MLEKDIDENFSNISKKYINNEISHKNIENFKNNINNYLKKYFVILNKKNQNQYIWIY